MFDWAAFNHTLRLRLCCARTFIHTKAVLVVRNVQQALLTMAWKLLCFTRSTASVDRSEGTGSQCNTAFTPQAYRAGPALLTYSISRPHTHDHMTPATGLHNSPLDIGELHAAPTMTAQLLQPSHPHAVTCTNPALGNLSIPHSLVPS